MIFQMTVGGSESPNDHQRSHQGNSGMIAFHQSEALMITDEILLRRIKNRERQRRYRERKRLEADMKKSHLIEHRLFCPAESLAHAVYGTRVRRERQRRYRERKRLEAVYETRVRSGRKWKKEARRVFSTRLENMGFEEALTEAESVVKENKNRSGRRDWKADARKKMDLEGCDCDPVVLSLSVWSDMK